MEKLLLGTGSDDTSGVFKSNGNYDVTLKTGNSTTGLIKIADGTNGNITIEPHGTGKTIIYEEFDDTNSADIKGAEFVKEANSNKVNLIISGDLTVKGDIDPKALILNRNPGGTSSDFNQYAADDLILYNDGGELKIHMVRGEQPNSNNCSNKCNTTKHNTIFNCGLYNLLDSNTNRSDPKCEYHNRHIEFFNCYISSNRRVFDFSNSSNRRFFTASISSKRRFFN